MTASPWAGRRLHFIGIGGAGMSGLALVAHALGAEVTGSDSAESSYVERLRVAGVAPVVGHAAANLPDGAEVVVSTAIPEDNPELEAARAAAATVLHRGDLLAEAAVLKRSIAVAGAHGKTTTAGMVAHVLAACGRDPAFLVGGELRGHDSNAAWGAGEWIVIEADESDRSFLKLRPDVAVVTNVELDHHATYRSPVELEAAFRQFVGGAGTAVVAADLDLDGTTFGIDAGDLGAEQVALGPAGSRFEVGGTEVLLALPGRHNVLNALAALAAVRLAGVEIAEAAPALASYAGAGRRFEDHGRTSAGARVVDDYAHHPTEVAATLETARRAVDGGRLIVCFQPHLFSRTRALARDFGRALALADEVVVLDIYPARERPEDFPGVSGWLVAAAAADAAGGRPVFWAPGHAEAERVIAERMGEGDMVLTLGAGDVDRVARALTGAPAAGPATAAP